MIAWAPKDFVDVCGCPRPKIFRGRPYNVMAVQNFVGAHNRPWTMVAVNCGGLWTNVVARNVGGQQLVGHPRFRGQFVGLRGAAWICMGACMDACEHPRFVQECGHISWVRVDVQRLRSLGCPGRECVVAQNRGACWMHTCVHRGHTFRVARGRSCRGRVVRQNGHAHIYASMPRAVGAPIFAPPCPRNFSRAGFASCAKFFKIFPP